MRERTPVDAGPFSSWLATIQDVIENGGTSDVPCGSCTACCTSSQFIHIAPDELDTLAKIPQELLFPAPRLPEGHFVMGYDNNGHCPMLIEGTCSIYEQRPRTCRTYDCRIFAASGVELETTAKSAISDQVSRWRFQLPERIDRLELEAVRSATSLLEEREPRLNPTERTLAAIEIHNQFLAVNPGQVGEPPPTPDRRKS